MTRSEEITAKALKFVDGDRYKLSLVVAKRANQLHNGEKPLVDLPNIKNYKFADIALMEIAEGKVSLDGIVKAEEWYKHWRLFRKSCKCKYHRIGKRAFFFFKEQADRLQKGVELCIKQHDGQFRKSGEPYAVHPILVASIVAFMCGDDDMVISALLHDVVEDTDYTLESVKEKFWRWCFKACWRTY